MKVADNPPKVIDEVITEVRAIKRTISERHGHDIDRLLDALIASGALVWRGEVGIRGGEGFASPPRHPDLIGKGARRAIRSLMSLKQTTSPLSTAGASKLARPQGYRACSTAPPTCHRSAMTFFCRVRDFQSSRMRQRNLRGIRGCRNPLLMKEIVFEVTQEERWRLRGRGLGGRTSLRRSIAGRKLRENVREAVNAFYFDCDAPERIRLHLMRDEVLSA